MLPQSSLCIGFGWRWAKITTTFIISNILRHTQTLKIESRHQAALCFVYQIVLKFQHFTAKIQRIFPFCSSSAITYFHMDLIERPEQKSLQLWHSDLSVQPTNHRWMSRGLLLPFRTANAEFLILCQSGLINWTGLLLAVLVCGLFPVRIIYSIIIFQMFYFEKRPGSHPVTCLLPHDE